MVEKKAKAKKQEKPVNVPKTRLIPNTLRVQIKNKVKISLLVLIGVAILIVGAIFAGRFFYKGWIDERETIANYINDNTEIYNETTRESQEIVLSINDLVRFDQDDSSQISANIAKIKEKLATITEAKASINSDIETFEQNRSEETEEVDQKFIDSSYTKLATLEGVENFLNYQVCLIDSSNKQSASLKQFKLNIEGFTNSDDSVTLENKLQFVTEAQNTINQNIEINNNLPNCFKDRYSRFLTNKIRADLQTDTILYENYSKFLSELSQGLTESDSPKVQSATEGLVDLSNQNPVFFASDSFKEAVQKSSEEIKDQAESLETQEKILTETINNLKTTYLL